MRVVIPSTSAVAPIVCVPAGSRPRTRNVTARVAAESTVTTRRAESAVSPLGNASATVTDLRDMIAERTVTLR
jgi:hypothetical protein